MHQFALRTTMNPESVAGTVRRIVRDDAERLCPGLPWRNIRGIGNCLRHRYERVDVETV